MNMLEDTQPNAEVVKNTLKRLKRMSDMITRRPKRTKNAVDRYSEQWSTEEEQAAAVVAIDVKVDDDNPDNATDDDNVTEDLEESSADDNVDDDDDLTAAKAKPAAVSLAPKHDASATKPQSKSETESVDYSSTDNNEDDAVQAVESSLARFHRLLCEYDEKHPLEKPNPCFYCHVCKAPDCGKCNTCLNMPKFGGPGFWKKRCIEKKCPFRTGKKVNDVDLKMKKASAIATVTAEFTERVKELNEEFTIKIKALESGADVAAAITGIGLDAFATIRIRNKIKFCYVCNSKPCKKASYGDEEMAGLCTDCAKSKTGDKTIEYKLIKGVSRALAEMTNNFCHFYYITSGMTSPENILNCLKIKPDAFWHKMANGPNLRVRVLLECDEFGHLSNQNSYSVK